MESTRIPAIDIAKGIGIILVVCGHYLPSDSPRYWIAFHDVLYRFHMPLFFVLSGYLYRGTSMEGYAIHVKKKALRLAVPFVSIAGFFFVIKWIPGMFVTLDHPVNPTSVLSVIINPVKSFLPLLWFVYALFGIFLVMPLLERVLRKRIWIFIAAIVLSFVGTTDYFCLRQMIGNLPHFAFGFWLSGRCDIREIRAGGKTVLYAIALVALFAATGALREVLIERRYALLLHASGLVSALSGSGICLLLAVLIGGSRAKRFRGLMESLGVYSMSIYLFHTLVTGPIRIAFGFVGVRHAPFALAAAVAVGAGLLLPLLMEKLVLRKHAVTRRLILGLPS